MIATDLRPNPPHNAMLVAGSWAPTLFLCAGVVRYRLGRGRFLPNWHIEAICHELSHVWRGETRRLIVTCRLAVSNPSAPPCACRPLFSAMTRSPDHCVSYSKACAQARQRLSRTYALQSLQAVFPTTRISPAKDTETEVMTTARGSRLATSVGAP